ncbi:MAG TPA: DNA polymerase domain-containing protein [Ktedonobacterales bacterium]
MADGHSTHEAGDRERREDEWLWGWDDTPGIVSVWADRSGRALVWRRLPDGTLVRESERFRPWLLLPALDDLTHLGERLAPEGGPDAQRPGFVAYAELEGPGHLRWRVSAADGGMLEAAVLRGASARLGRRVTRLAELGGDEALWLPPEEQYLIATGRTSFRGLAFDDLHRLQFDLETTGLDPRRDAIFLVAVRDNRGLECVLDASQEGVTGNAEHAEDAELRRGRGGDMTENAKDAKEREGRQDGKERGTAEGAEAESETAHAVAEGAEADVAVSASLADSSRPSRSPHSSGVGSITAAGEAELIRRLAALIRERDPDVIENHNLHGFDLPFLVKRAEVLGVRLVLGRISSPAIARRGAARRYGPPRDGVREEGGDDEASGRYTVPGRELIDTLDAVRRYDFAARALPSHGLKAVARHFGLASPDREYVEGAEVYATWRRDPARVRRYALDDVREVDGLARLLSGAAFALARMAPRRYERLADAGPATGILDPLLVRAYLRSDAALPARPQGDGTSHTGAALYLFAAGVARRVVKADVASLYPSLMRQYRIVPRTDRLGALLALVDRLVEQRLAAKARARQAPPDSPARHTDEALSAAMKILVNSAYGYLGATSLTRFADVHAANEVTRRGRELLGMLCRELAARGATLLEADTDGVYVAVPEDWDEARERRMVAEVAALLPPLVRLEFEGRYAAMLSHEPKNYALLEYDATLHLRGVAFRSVRFEPFGEAFLRRAVRCLLEGDVPGVRAAYAETATAIRARALPAADFATRVRLTKTPQAYLKARASRRELPYEALLASGRSSWKVGERLRVYRATGGRSALLPNEGAAGGRPPDAPTPHDYDVEYYLRLLRETFAARMERAFTRDDFAVVFGAPEQPSLFAPPIETIQPVLAPVMDIAAMEE